MEVITIESEVYKQLLKDLKEIKEEVKQNRVENLQNIWLSSQQVQKILGISQKTWQSYRDRKMIQFTQVGQKIYVRASWLEEFLLKNKIEAK